MMRLECWSLAAGLLMAGCGGGQSGPRDAADAAPMTTPSASRYSAAWDFASSGAWFLSAEPGSGARAVVEAGVLTLESSMSTSASGQIQCPVAAAEVAFGDSTSQVDGDQVLVITLQVLRWDLGQGLMGTHPPRLEVRHHGQRSSLPVSGFSAMPGSAVLRWQRGSGWSAAYNGGVAMTLQPPVVSEAGPPILRLWTDGCSEGMSQSLRIARVQVDAD